MKPKVNRSEIIKIRVDQWNEELVLWEDKIDKPLSRFTKKKEIALVNKIRNERESVTVDTTEVERSFKEY